MKIKTRELSYDEVVSLPARKHKKPVKPNVLLDKLIVALSKSELEKVNFLCEYEGFEKIGKNEPCLILMNHSSFIDLKIAKTIMKDRPFQIVCTSDGFVGKEGLMRRIGCIPTQKFVTDINLVRDMKYCVDKLNTSVLLFPEASYSFDGTATPLPDSLSKCIKMLNVHVIFIETFGAFHRDPLYNGLRLRKVDVTAKASLIFHKDELKELSIKYISDKLNDCFSFDHFRWQDEGKIKVDEDFRTLGLERVLYKCPACKTEGNMKGEGTKIKCSSCNKIYYMSEYGRMKAENGETEFPHIPDWYRWERECVREEIESDTYLLDIPVDIAILKDFNAIYKVGEGRLKHNKDGFRLNGCDGKLDYSQSRKSSYSLYADYFWYEIDDVICIGDSNTLYYCFPKTQNHPVAKTRLATEELFRI